MNVTGTFTEGIINKEGQACKAFTLEVETFRHSLEAVNDPAIAPLLTDDAYYSAALFSKRLQVEGIPRVTPDMILDLSRADGQALLAASAEGEQRRQEFRNAAQAAAPPPGGPPEDRS